MFGAFNTFGKLGAGARAVAAAWSPLALWPTGTEPGMWIDPSDLTSQWQDYQGTTPVVTPGTVADSANPVGLALDIRAGDPVLGPELVTASLVPYTENGTASVAAGVTTATCTTNGVYGLRTDTNGMVGGFTYALSFEVVTNSASRSSLNCYPNLAHAGLYIGASPVIKTYNMYAPVASGANANLAFVMPGGLVGESFSVRLVSMKVVSGNHMLQATSAARPLLSAYDGQTLGPGDTYPSTGFPIYQKYDGTDDGMATATFAAGTLINGMDCMIAVRRDSAAACVLFGTLAGFGYFESGGYGASMQGCGTPTALVDGVQVAGGTGVTGNELHSALTVGDWHIFEAQNLDLSSWTALAFSEFSGYQLNGARGDIMLYPSTASTADKDKARQYLADKYGVTLP